MSYTEIIDKKFLEAESGINEEWFTTSDTSWYDYISRLKNDLKVTYLITTLHSQVFNGGFHQYFVNGYGQFAAETITALIEVGAIHKSELLKRALLIVNTNGDDMGEFRRRLMNRDIKELFEEDSLFDPLDILDSQYYESEEIEQLEDLLGRFLLQN